MRPALWLAGAFAIGITMADWIRPHPLVALGVVCIAGIWAAVARRGAVVLLLCAVAALGALRFSYAQTAGRGDLSAWEGQQVTLVGTVTVEPEPRLPRGFGYALTVAQVDGHPAQGAVSIFQREGTAPGFGERVAVTGTLKAPLGARTPGGFDEAAYLTRQGIYATMEPHTVHPLGPGDLNPVWRFAVQIRLKLEQRLKAFLPPRDAVLMDALLFGHKTDLPDDVKAAFRDSGVLHLLAVSGAKLALILFPCLWALRYALIDRRRVAMAALPIVALFLLLMGAGPSVLRAGFVTGLLLLGVVLRREKNALNTLGAAALCLLLWRPDWLFDFGFQFSMSAAFGILLLQPILVAWLQPRLDAILGGAPGKWMAIALSYTLAAELMVEPLSLYHMGMISLIAPVANLLVLTFAGLVIQGGWVAVLVSLVSLPLASLLAWPVRLGLWLLLFIVKATAAVPFAALAIASISVWWLVLWYGMLLVVVFPSLRAYLIYPVAWWRTTAQPARLSLAAAMVLLVATGSIWRLALADPPDTLRLTMLDIGQGDALVLQAPGGYTMLIDAGPAAPPEPKRGLAGYDTGASVVVPFLKQQGIRKLDYVVLTHPHQDHAGGMAAVMQAFPVSQFLDTALAHDADGYAKVLQVVQAKQIPVHRPVAGERITLGPAVTLDVLNPPDEQIHGTRSDENSNSIVFLLQYRHIRMLLAGDMEAVVEERLLAEGAPVQVDLLKVAHHGSGFSSTQLFLERVHPRWALISVGAGNLFGHPDKGTLERLRGQGAAIYRTDQVGAVTVKTNGTTLTIDTAKPIPVPNTVGIFGRRWIFAW